ncbi:hypothetical protein RND71_038178 [Anisodus tanguticus]|uniref:Uncharacterized protein n=1 Tax=Anisodus tanguticus TaxID=243964 RepID=A0AAE1R259_9SOLA|nr:hypothetical protein RND71_038178 [Anisodus tanguticus]
MVNKITDRVAALSVEPAPISIRAGPIDIPIIKSSVNWWNTLHQQQLLGRTFMEKKKALYRIERDDFLLTLSKIESITGDTQPTLALPPFFLSGDGINGLGARSCLRDSFLNFLLRDGGDLTQTNYPKLCDFEEKGKRDWGDARGRWWRGRGGRRVGDGVSPVVRWVLADFGSFGWILVRFGRLGFGGNGIWVEGVGLGSVGIGLVGIGLLRDEIG